MDHFVSVNQEIRNNTRHKNFFTAQFVIWNVVLSGYINLCIELHAEHMFISEDCASLKKRKNYNTDKEYCLSIDGSPVSASDITTPTKPSERDLFTGSNRATT